MRLSISLYYLIVFLNSYAISNDSKTNELPTPSIPFANKQDSITQQNTSTTLRRSLSKYTTPKYYDEFENDTELIQTDAPFNEFNDLNDLKNINKLNSTTIATIKIEKNPFDLKRNTKNINQTNKIVNERKLGKINIVATSAYLISTEKYQDLKIKRNEKLEIPTKSPYIVSSTEHKNHLPKKYISSTTLKSINQPKSKKERGPTKVLIPVASASEKRLNPSYDDDGLICPKETEAKFNLFAPSCKSNSDCTSWSRENRCCKLFGSRNCHKAVARPLDEPSHKPFLGIARKCPEHPLAELWWDLKTCETDNDCWPRVCCPDGANRYCRTSRPEYESVPFQIGRPLAYFSEYLECTAPPPPVFDLHPKQCKSTFDCFPNVCCQEAGKKHCRPPKKSVLSFMANFLNNGLIKRLTNNLVIKR